MSAFILLQERFEEAVTMVGKEFRERVLYFRDVWLPARDIVLEAVQKRHTVNRLYF